jgi:hypothetical protein
VINPASRPTNVTGDVDKTLAITKMVQFSRFLSFAKVALSKGFYNANRGSKIIVDGITDGFRRKFE